MRRYPIISDAFSARRWLEPHVTPLAATSEVKASGFTLIELVAVLSVLVVASSMMLPGILRWQRGMPMEQAVTTLQLQLQETRLAAIRTGEPWILILPQNGQPGYRRPQSLQQQTTDLHKLGMPFRWPEGIQCDVVGDSNAVTPIVFQPDGTVCNCQFTLSDNAGHRIWLNLDRLTGLASV